MCNLIPSGDLLYFTAPQGTQDCLNAYDSNFAASYLAAGGGSQYLSYNSSLNSLVIGNGAAIFNKILGTTAAPLYIKLAGGWTGLRGDNTTKLLTVAPAQDAGEVFFDPASNQLSVSTSGLPVNLTGGIPFFTSAGAAGAATITNATTNNAKYVVYVGGACQFGITGGIVGQGAATQLSGFKNIKPAICGIDAATMNVLSTAEYPVECFNTLNIYSGNNNKYKVPIAGACDVSVPTNPCKGTPVCQNVVAEQNNSTTAIPTAIIVNPPPSTNSGLNLWQILAICVGTAVGLFFIGLVIYLYLQRRRAQEKAFQKAAGHTQVVAKLQALNAFVNAGVKLPVPTKLYSAGDEEEEEEKKVQVDGWKIGYPFITSGNISKKNGEQLRRIRFALFIWLCRTMTSPDEKLPLELGLPFPPAQKLKPIDLNTISNLMDLSIYLWNNISESNVTALKNLNLNLRPNIIDALKVQNNLERKINCEEFTRTTLPALGKIFTKDAMKEMIDSMPDFLFGKTCTKDDAIKAASTSRGLFS